MLDGGGDRVAQVWRLFAYLGRYGHQPVSVTRHMPLRELRVLSTAISEIVEEENAPRKGSGMDY